MKKRTICHQRKSLKTFARSEYSICLSWEQRITKQIHLLYLWKKKNNQNKYIFFFLCGVLQFCLCSKICTDNQSVQRHFIKPGSISYHYKSLIKLNILRYDKKNQITYTAEILEYEYIYSEVWARPANAETVLSPNLT